MNLVRYPAKPRRFVIDDPAYVGRFAHPKHHNNVMTAYINSMRTHRHSDKMIREQLISVGWKTNVIDKLLK